MLARSVTVNLLGQAGSLAIGFVASIALARWLGPADRGLYGIMVYASEIAIALFGLGLPYAVVYYASKPDAPRGALLGNSLAFGALLGIVFVPGFWLLRGPIADAFSRGHGRDEWVLASVLIPLSFLDWSIHNQLFGKLRFGLLNSLIVASRVVSLLAIVALVGAAGWGVAGALVASIAAALVMAGGSLAVVLRDARPRVDWPLLRRMTAYGARVTVGSVFQIVNYRADVLVLQLFYPLSSVGYYLVAQVVAELPLTIASAFQTSLTTLVSHYEGDERREQTTVASLRHQGILTALTLLLDVGVGAFIVLVLYGPGFHPALVPMLILLPGMWFLSNGIVVTGDLRGRGRPGMSSALAAVTMVVTLALDFALIPPFGVVGAAVASVSAYTVYGVLSLAVISRVTGIGVRGLVVPTRADLALYPRAARLALARARGVVRLGRP